MRYTLLIKKQAKKTLQSLGRTDRNRIAEKITLLGENPDNPLLIPAICGYFCPLNFLHEEYSFHPEAYCFRG